MLRTHNDDARKLICIGRITLARGKIRVPLIREHFAKFGDHLPKGMTEEVDKLEEG